MSSSLRSHSRVAHVEDAEEDSGGSVNGIEGTRKYATSRACMSPLKIQPNSGKSRSDKRLVHSKSSSASPGLDEAGPSDKKGKPLTRRTLDREHGELEPKIRDRDRRRREQRFRDEDNDEDDDEEGNRRAAAAAAAQAKPAKAKTNEQDSRPLRNQRPPSLKSSATQPVIQQMYKRGHVDNPTNYGIQQPAITGNRPRAQTRPASYYAGQPIQPPPMHMPWLHPPTSAQFPAGTFPPPQWQGPGASPGSFAGPPPPPSPVGPPAGFFDGPGVAANSQSHLRYRFDSRPSSAMGYHRPGPPPPSRPPPSLDYYDPEALTDEPARVSRLARRTSRTRRAEDDRNRMPPPEHIPIRPQSALPPSTPYRPPPLPQPPTSRKSQSRPPPVQRRSVGFADQPVYDDDDSPSDDDLFHDISPNASFDQRQPEAHRPRRASVAYNIHDYDVMPEASRGQRSSVYGAALPSGGASLDEKKYSAALRYQEVVGGAPQMPLTAETLRKAGKRGAAASSRSTRSSGSRDDSDYRRSNATGITRTSFNSDDFTIKVSGGARVRVPGAEIECDDGGEITFSTRPNGSRSGSEKASLMCAQLEDSRSRSEQRSLPYRGRAPSQSDSQSRRSYAPSPVGYDFSGGYYI
ncbi:uncharacterized protein MAM_01325 [Metarhizium album ARSEF 1941]|uniref:Uncharacterized protein n=1 Tax=Metarhizium album (strain ARSEF 1941) TaxID=1081103 RepID=A0A0B2WWF4_METAS|nr:uncharacterized protein MAM_01325 [Metarhizium album ARSEF 1941]KHO00547.1 hypothetical protein MAM_01325 [Metarhizium album ARSEF 1941]